VQPRGAIGGVGDLVALLVQRPSDHPGDAFVVLNEQQPHAPMMSDNRER
jgi:hypothetical protein